MYNLNFKICYLKIYNFILYIYYLFIIKDKKKKNMNIIYIILI